MTIKLKTVSNEFHEATKHSPLSVMLDPNYVDASTQPTVFKHYPHFYRRFPLEEKNQIHEFIRLTSAITFTKKYRYDSYQLRVNPSAGALYPTEIYVQIRGIKGLIDGIYHLEIATNSLTLIYELIDDGLEAYILPNSLIKGFIFLVTCVYYRSSWKYKNRSLRYCFLDSGHHLGAIEAAAYLNNRDLQVIFDFDKLALNQDLGLENKEFATAVAISGTVKEKAVRKLRLPLPFVAPTDYFEPNSLIESGYRNTIDNIFNKNQQNNSLKSSERTEFRTTLGLNRKVDSQVLAFNYNSDKFRQTIITRRSARAFKGEPISLAEWQEIWNFINQSLPTESQENLELYLVVNAIAGMKSGLYQGDRILKSGDFKEQAKYLCVNQALARDSAVTFFVTASYSNYQTAMQCAGWFGHRLYLITNYLGIGCSGIGAYYDDETQSFLNTTNDIIYALAIGH